MLCKKKRDDGIHKNETQKIQKIEKLDTCGCISPCSDIIFVHNIPEGGPATARIILGCAVEMTDVTYNTAKKRSDNFQIDYLTNMYVWKNNIELSGSKEENEIAGFFIFSQQLTPFSNPYGGL